MEKGYVISLALAGTLAMTINASAQAKKPQMATLRGTVVDLTCTSKAYAMGMQWANTKEDHMMDNGNIQQKCATMCLQGGQPAALFTGSTLTAVLACDPRATLSKYASKQVEVQGFWGVDGKEVKTFVPQRIREGAGAWADVTCAEMH